MSDGKNVVERTLATVVRKGYGDKKDEQLRVDLCSYDGKPYVSIRLWSQGNTPNEWFPSKKGLSVRMGELDDVMAALMDAGSLETAQGRPPTAPPEHSRDKADPKPRPKRQRSNLEATAAGVGNDPAFNPDGTIDDDKVFS